MTLSAVTLIGMPGVGKTTLGQGLAKALQLQFVDTDQLLEQQEQLSLQHILERVGAARLRVMEGELALRMSLRDRVIATGGSMVYSSTAMARLYAQTRCVYLTVSLKTLQERLGDLSQRGFASPGLSLVDVFHERAPLYQTYAHITLDLEGQSVDESLNHLIDAIKYM